MQNLSSDHECSAPDHMGTIHLDKALEQSNQMTNVWEQCLNPACKRFEECRAPSSCIADAEKDIWNEAIEAAARISDCQQVSGAESISDWAATEARNNVAKAIRALKRQ